MRKAMTLVAVALAVTTGGGMTAKSSQVDRKILMQQVTDCQAGAASATVIIPGGKMHEGINRGKVPTKALVTFIVEKGKPLSTPAPAR